MQAMDVLMTEHRLMEQVLNCLGKMAGQAKTTGALDLASATEMVEFLRGFADQCHHAKEENLLFPLLETKKGFPEGCGPTAVMRAEHELGRIHVRGMRETAQRGQPDAVDAFVEHAEAYLRLLRDPIQKEDHCLFPRAAQTLMAEEDQALVDKFTKVEMEEMGGGVDERFHVIADMLAARFAVPRATL